MSNLVDSDWLIDALLGTREAAVLLARLRTEGLAVSIVSFGELFEGVVRSPDPEAELANVRRLLGSLALMLLEEPTMENFARLRAGLRRSGRLIADLDVLIAATAIQYDLTLLTRNVRHVARVPGLRL